MNKSHRVAGWILFMLSVVAMIFHCLVITGLIPYKIVWGGRISSTAQMIKYELASLIVNSFMLLVVGVKSEILHLHLPKRFIIIMLWFMVAAFALNTVGNLFSLNQVEKFVFAPLTLIAAILALKLATHREDQ